MPFRLNAPLATACAVAVSLLLVACGGSTSKATATQENEEKLVKFAKCMREHGLSATTSTGSGGAGLRIQGAKLNPQAMEAAQNACKRYQPSAGKENLTPQQKVEREEAVMKFAKCMREHGINVHASTAGGGVQIQIHREGAGGERGPNPESPTFQAAQKACQGLLPFKGGGPGPGQTTSGVNGAKGGSGPSLAIGG
jgi:hypothetical protein